MSMPFYVSPEQMMQDNRDIITAVAEALLKYETLTGDEVHALMSFADAYVSLHRSEGFGLTLATALTVIGFGVSGCRNRCTLTVYSPGGTPRL